MDDQERATLRDLLPAYALGALDEEELRFVEEHLGDAPEYARELTALRETAALLALATPPVVPSPSVKRSLMARIERLESAAPAATAPPSGAPVMPPPRPRRFRTALVAVAAALLLALVGWNTVLQWQLRTERQERALLAAQTTEGQIYERLLNDPQAAHVVIGSGPGRYNLPPAGYLYSDPNSSIALMLTYWLPPIEANQQYQLWLVTADGTRDNGGVFSDDGHGNAHVVIHAPATFAKYKSVGVTIEPLGGSAWPTGQRIIGGDLR